MQGENLKLKLVFVY